jgi:hypothetical protein
MSYYAHLIKKNTHPQFLLEQRKDPISKEALGANDMVVICAQCKSAFMEDTWTGFLKGEHCKQTDTLDVFHGVKGYLVAGDGEEPSVQKPTQTLKIKRREQDKQNTKPQPAPPVRESLTTTNVISRMVLGLIILVLIGKIVYDRFWVKPETATVITDTTSTKNAAIDSKTEKLKNITRTIIHLSEKKHPDYFPDQAKFKHYFERHITLKENDTKKYLNIDDYFENRIIDYLEKVTWDSEIIDENSWKIDSQGEHYQLSVEFDYKSRYKNDLVVKARAYRTYKFNQDLKIYEREDKVLESHVWKPVPIQNVLASSFLTGKRETYSPYNATDARLKSWWSPETSDEYSWIRVDFDKTVEISGIAIHGGSHYPNFPDYGNIYRQNYRIKEAVLEFSDGNRNYITLDDVDRVQVRLLPKTRTSYVILKVKKKYATARWEDICISHLRFLQKIK